MKTKLLLILIVILSFVLRVYKLAAVPPALYWDEAAIALDAKSVASTAKDHHGNVWYQPIYPSWGDYKLPGYILTAVPFFKLIKSNYELAVRLPSALAGVLTVFAVYFLTKELFKNHLKSSILNFISLMASLLLAVSPWHLQFSRAAFEGNLALLFNTLSLLFIFKAIKNKVFLVPALFFSVFGIYTYYSSRIVLPLILFSVFLLFWKKNLKNIISFIIFLSLVVLLCLPLRFSKLSYKAEQFRLSAKNILTDSNIIKYSSSLIEKDGNNLVSRKLHHRFLYQLKTLASHYFDHFSLNFLVLRGDNNLRHSTGRIGVLLIVGFIGFIFGEHFLYKKNKLIFSFLNLCLIITFLPASVPYEVPHALRSLNAVVFINIISGLGLVNLIKHLKLNNKLLFFVLCSLFFVQLILYFHDYYVHYPSRSFLSWQGGYRQAVTIADQELNQSKNIIFTNAYARPYIYFLLYSHFPVQTSQSYRQQYLSQKPSDYSETAKIDKIIFRNINFYEDQKLDKVLLIGTPEEIPDGDKIIDAESFVWWKNY